MGMLFSNDNDNDNDNDYGYSNENKLSKMLMSSAKYFCEIFSIDENTIEIDESHLDYSVKFGSIENDGMVIRIFVYRENEINRIILSAGINSSGHSIYSETREQEILDKFLYKDYDFSTWAYNILEKLEDKF